MIELRRAAARQHTEHQDQWNTLYPQGEADPLALHFGRLQSLKEGHLSPQSGGPEPRRDTEVLTYVRRGTLTYGDSFGRCGVIHASEFQRMAAGRGIVYSETNASPVDWAHVFQFWLHSAVAGLEPRQEQKRFSVAERRGRLCVVASPDGRGGSLRVHQDASLFSAVLDRGQHLVHRFTPSRCGWLHVVEGKLAIDSDRLVTGDAAGIMDEPYVSLTAVDDTEILLLDLCATAREGSARSVSGESS